MNFTKCSHYMVKLLLLLAGLLAVTGTAQARSRYQNFCEKGGQTLSIAGMGNATGTPLVQGSYPSCTVTVYLTGTLTLATLYSDNSGTPKANPFTANTSGYLFFYADDGRYDVTISGGGMGAPFTYGDVQLNASGGGGGGNGCGNGNPTCQVADGGTGATTATQATANLAYLAPWTGAQARSDAAKFGDTVSVLDAGADRAGLIDSSAAFQAAINSASVRTGANVYVPCGVYQLSTTLNVTVPGVGIVGEAKGCVRLNYTGTTGLLRMMGGISGLGGELGNFTIGVPNGVGVTSSYAVWTNSAGSYYHDISVDSCDAATGFKVDNGNIPGAAPPDSVSYFVNSTWRNLHTSHCALGYGFGKTTAPAPDYPYMLDNQFTNLSADVFTNQVGMQLSAGPIFERNNISLSCNMINLGTGGDFYCVKSAGDWNRNVADITGTYTPGSPAAGTAYAVQIASGATFNNIGGAVNIRTLTPVTPGVTPFAAQLPVQNLATDIGTPTATMAQQERPAWDTGSYTLGALGATVPWTAFRDTAGVGQLGLLEGTNAASPFVSMLNVSGNKFVIGKTAAGQPVGSMTEVSNADLDGNFNATGGFKGQTYNSTATTTFGPTNGVNSNIALGTSGFLVLSGGTASTAFSIGGFANGVNGRELTVFNHTGFQMTVLNSDGGSTSTNQISTLTGANVILQAGDSGVLFRYVSAVNKWVMIAANGNSNVASTPIATKTANYTAVSTDNILLAQTNGGAFTITLPAVPTVGEVLIIQNIGSNAVTIATNGKNVNGATTAIVLPYLYGLCTFRYDGTQWFQWIGDVQDYASVKFFGAKGDGVTDDTAAIQTALNYCAATVVNKDIATFGGRLCYFPDGTYEVSNTLQVMSSVELSPAATIQAMDSLAIHALNSVIDVGSTGDVWNAVFRGGQIDVNQKAFDGIRFRQYKHLLVENTTVLNVYLFGYIFCDSSITNQCFEAVIRNNKVAASTSPSRPLGTKWWLNGSTGMVIEEDGTDNYVTDNFFTQTNIGVTVYSGGNYMVRNHAYAYPNNGMNTAFEDYGDANFWLQDEADSTGAYGLRVKGFNTVIDHFIGFMGPVSAGGSDNTLDAIVFDQQFPDAVVTNSHFNGTAGARLKHDITGLYPADLPYQLTAHGNKFDQTVTPLYPANYSTFPGVVQASGGLSLQSGPTMTHTPDMLWQAATADPATTTPGAKTYMFKPIFDINLTAIDWQVVTPGHNCVPRAVIAVYVNGVVTAFTSTILGDVNNGTTFGSLDVTSGSIVTIQTATAQSGCATPASTVYPVLHYRMQ